MTKAKNRVVKVALLLVFLFTLMPATWANQGEQIPLAEIKEHVEKFYVESVSEDVLAAQTVEELFEKLGDKHSGYLNPKNLEDFKISSSQEYAGVGIQLEMLEEYLIVNKVFPNTPAEKAGVQIGDRFQAINGEDIEGLPMEDVVRLIRGTPGTSVLIEFLREGEPKPVLVFLTRELIHLAVLESRLLEPGIGYIDLDFFTPTVGNEFVKALAELQAQNLQGLILDVRQNPGGYLTASLDIGSIFAGAGEPLLHVVDREGTSATYQSNTKGLDIPVVVLVDEDSASASEIVAGIIQDSGAGWIVGTKTYGKASVQTLFPLSNGGAVKLTTAKYLTPDKHDINGVGLTPDQIIAEPEDQLAGGVAFLQEKLSGIAVPLVVALNFGSEQALRNGQEVALDISPYQFEGQMLVPLRSVGEFFGLKLDWDGTNSQVRGSIKDKELWLQPDKKRIVINGKEQELVVAPIMKKERIMVPVRFLAEFLGASCEYDMKSGTVTITR